MRQFTTSISVMILSLVLMSCSPSNVNIVINETGSQSISLDEVVHLNNCGGKADSRQTAARSFSTSLEVETSLKVNYQILEGSVAARYGQYRNVSKSQELIAPPQTNMEFVLRWSEQQWSGILSADGQAGTYKAQVPVSVELVTSRDLGCDTHSQDQQQQPQTAPQRPPSTLAPQIEIPTNVEVAISADQGWQNSGITLQTGQSFRVNSVSGQWTYWKDQIALTDADGGTYACSGSSCCEPLPGQHSGALIGKVGANVFLIGNGGSFSVNQAGPLQLRMNDCDSGLNDNSGSITIAVEVAH